MTTKNEMVIIILLRLAAILATLTAVVIMVTAHDSSTVLNLTFQVEYNDTPSFKYFVIVEAMASCYTLISIIILMSSKWRWIVVFDVITTMLLSSSLSAALAVAYLGKKGNTHAGWLPICGQVSKFCHKVAASLIAGFAAAIIYLVSSLYSIYSIFAVKP